MSKEEQRELTALEWDAGNPCYKMVDRDYRRMCELQIKRREQEIDSVNNG